MQAADDIADGVDPRLGRRIELIGRQITQHRAGVILMVVPCPRSHSAEPAPGSGLISID
jgi:hypothetical protein